MQKCIKRKSTQAHNCQDGNGKHSDNEFFLNNLKIRNDTPYRTEHQTRANIASDSNNLHL